MKNFKLLLATTAILSTGLAMGANATFKGETTQVDLKAEIIHARVLDATPIDFGRIVISNLVPDEQAEIFINIDAEGKETIDQQLSTVQGYILDKGQKGVVTGATCEQLSYDEEAFITSGEITTPAGDVLADTTIINCKTTDGKATFYTRLRIISTDTTKTIPVALQLRQFIQKKRKHRILSRHRILNYRFSSTHKAGLAKGFRLFLYFVRIKNSRKKTLAKRKNSCILRLVPCCRLR